MSVLYDYFHAPTREAAVAIFADPAVRSKTDDDRVEFKGVDPDVVLAKLVGLLSGVTFMEMLLSGIPVKHIPDPVLLSGSDSSFLVELSEVVLKTLARATDAELAEAAGPWAGIEEFSHYNELSGDDVLPWMEDLRALARRAGAADETLYCAIGV